MCAVAPIEPGGVSVPDTRLPLRESECPYGTRVTPVALACNTSLSTNTHHETTNARPCVQTDSIQSDLPRRDQSTLMSPQSSPIAGPPTLACSFMLLLVGIALTDGAKDDPSPLSNHHGSAVTDIGLCAAPCSPPIGDCERDLAGIWERVDTLQVCVAKCSACAQCTHVSFSTEQRECFWWRFCDLQNLHTHAYSRRTNSVPQSYQTHQQHSHQSQWLVHSALGPRYPPIAFGHCLPADPHHRSLTLTLTIPNRTAAMGALERRRGATTST